MSFAGYCLLRNTQRLMETFHLPRRANPHSRGGDNERDVLLHLHAPDGHNGFHQWSTCRNFRRNLSS